MDEPHKLLVGHHSMRQHNLAARLGLRIQKVAFRPEPSIGGRHDFLANSVQRRVSYLSKKLLEIVKQHPRSVGKHRHRRVRPHRPHRLFAVLRHRSHEHSQLFMGVAEAKLPLSQICPKTASPNTPSPKTARPFQLMCRQVVQIYLVVVQPSLIRPCRSQLGFDLLVTDDAPFVGVHEEHPPRLQPPLLHHFRLRHIHHPHFRCHDHQPFTSHPIAAGAQAVAIQHRAYHLAVGESDGGRAVPRLHQRGVIAIERFEVGRHGFVILPRLRDHHQHSLLEGIAAQMQKLQAFVKASSVGELRRADRKDALYVA